MISEIKRSCKIAERLLMKCIKQLPDFKTEKGVYDFFKEEVKKQNCNLSFKPIIASAKNSSIIHYQKYSSKLKKGFLVLDIGVKYKGYCSDITRTVYLGKPTKKETELYNLVLNAQKKSFRAIKIGMKCNDLDGVARDSLGYYKKYFKHSLGHGVGKKVHMGPNIGPKNNRRLKNNTIFTIEPGIYLPNKFGIRIEDMVLLRNKPIYLTKITRKLITI